MASKSFAHIHAALDEYDRTIEGQCHSLDLDLSCIICRAMKDGGWTRQSLAKASGVSVSRVASLMAGGENWTRSTAIKVLHALGVRVELTLNPNKRKG